MTAGRSLPWTVGVIVTALLVACKAGPAASFTPDSLRGAWPDPVAGGAGAPVAFPSRSPFALTDVGRGGEREPVTEAVGHLFMPTGASAARPAPGVVILHGAGGVRGARELTYGRQLSAMGIAALVVDAFAARRDRARGFTQRLLEITESMLMADAYAALRLFAARPDVDGDRVALIGFSYGGMAATYAAYAQVAERFAPDGLRFAGHAAYYAPCIARFDRPRTTGAPVLMLMGALDEIIDPARCAEIAGDLEVGGSDVRMVVYDDAYHQWDGSAGRRWRAPRGLAECRLEVEEDGDIRDRRTLLAMSGPLTRKIILGLCSDGDGYVIASDARVRSRSNRELGAFLARVLARAPADGKRW